MALWGGRFTQAADERFKSFNDSLAFDCRMVREDIEGSAGWARAIASAGVITGEELDRLLKALGELLAEAEGDLGAVAASGYEDVHSYVEAKLIEKVGDLGKKLHTGRSRNDQVATDLKLWCRKEARELRRSVTALERILTEFAEKHAGTVMPGYTHLQRAQPVTLGHWALAYAEMFDRDYLRLGNCLELMDSCPLGSGALAGTAYPVDREKLAADLGFARATRNSLDSVADRDHVLELLGCASISMVHLSRMAEDLIFYNSGEAAFIELSDRVTSGSSLMPQKKNPDACELIRGKAGRVFGSLAGMLATLKGLPLAYNKDMQEDKEGLFDALDTWRGSLDMAGLLFSDLRVNEARTLAAAQGGYSNATELADYLVARGIPFREAHRVAGEAVVYAIGANKPLEELTVAELRKFSAVIGDDVYPVLSVASALAKRAAPGGASPERVREAARLMRERLAAREL